MNKPAIGVDFDGTLVEHEPIFNQFSYGPTYPGALEFIRALAQKFTVIIFSARASQEEGKKTILKWVRQNNLRHYIYDVTNEKKFSFVAYVDDRAITFNNPGDYVSITDALGCPIHSDGSIYLDQKVASKLEPNK